MLAKSNDTELVQYGEGSEVEKIDALEVAFLDAGTAVDLPPVNYFAPGIYMREVTMLAGEIIIGHLHKTNHFNIVLSGLAEVSINGEVHLIRGGDVFESGANVRKALRIIEDMRWITVHPNEDNCEDIDELSNKFVETSPAYKEYKKMIEEANKLGGAECLGE